MEETRRVRAFLGLGSNLGEREESLRRALELLSSSGEIEVVKASSLYETKPVGYTGQPDFLNQVAEVETVLEPRALLRRCLQVEDGMGRVRQERWGPRVIDVDVLLYGDTVMDEEELVLPHPEMLKRAFVLVPLLEIAPGLQMPDGRRAADSLEALTEQGRAGVVKAGEAGLPAGQKSFPERAGRRKRILPWAIAATVGLCVLAVILVISLVDQSPRTRQIVIETDRGTIVVDLEEKDAPQTTVHVEAMVNNGSYQGSGFYYVDETAALAGIEGRDPTANIDAGALQAAQQQDDRVIAVVDEIKLPNVRGAVGVAKPSDPKTGKPARDSGTNEFYILKQDASGYLDSDFAIFGQVSEGMDVVDGLGVGEEITSFTLDQSGRYVTIEQGTGKIVIELKPEEAPQTVQHFTDLIKAGFYQGMNWYRVEDFVVQTGSHLRSLQAEAVQAVDPLTQAEEAKIVPDELKLPPARGAVGMYKQPDITNQAPSQPQPTTEFFFLKKDLSGQGGFMFTIFGRVVEGMDVVDALQEGDVITEIYLREVKQ